MDEASKQKLRGAICLAMDDLDIIARERFGICVELHVEPIILRLITEAEGRAHAQAIAAAAECVAYHCDGFDKQIILALTRPAAELRARIEVARARQDAISKIEWLPLAKKLSGYFKAFGQDIHPNKIVLFIEENVQVKNDPALADLETQLAALDAKGGQ